MCVCISLCSLSIVAARRFSHFFSNGDLELRSENEPSTLLFLVGCVVVLLRARGDVVDVEVVLRIGAPVFVILVQPTDRTLFDRSFGTPVVLSHLLALVLGRRVGPEIAIARAAWRASPFGSRRPSAWARRVAGTGWCAARTRSTVSARTRRASRTLFTRTGFAYRKRASLERLLVEPADGRFGDCAIRVIHKCETARPSCFTIDRENDLGRFTDAG